MPQLENPFSLEASDERQKKKILAGQVESPTVTKSGKATSRKMEPPNNAKISAVAAQISQKSTSQKVWDAMPWGAVVGLVMAFVGGIIMLTGVSLFYAYPMWDRGDHTMASFSGYASLVGLVLLFDVRRSATDTLTRDRPTCVRCASADSRRRAVHRTQVRAARASERPWALGRDRLPGVSPDDAQEAC
jgi:hypothetical protein